MKKWRLLFFAMMGVFEGFSMKDPAKEPLSHRPSPNEDLDKEVQDIISILSQEEAGVKFENIFKEKYEDPALSQTPLPQEGKPLPEKGRTAPKAEKNVRDAGNLPRQDLEGRSHLSSEELLGEESIPLQKAIEILRKNSKLPPWKARFTCPDVLSGVAANPPDQAVNFVCQLCYTYCMAITVIAEYVSVLRKKGMLTEKIKQDAMNDFERLYPMADTLVRACEAGFWAFLHGDLRNKLNAMQVEMQQQLLDREKPY